ncbi:hypothetical protein CVT24_005833 [Panaeolus cyanescens]|uniref:Uncharacterized protein n=1 Tax=Panaeolus cyanescens TaxID=181874 RepID=A0A409V919_9AGAR|nr:hypothetical protein CVT24_005833 [Panaeolus cyanescens]
MQDTMTTSVHPTIFGELKQRSPKSAATDLNILLLKNYVIEMKESRRNLLTSGQLLFRGKQAFYSIETLIEKVNTSALTNFSSAWADFENYPEVIAILERILSDFHLKVPTGLNSYARTHLPPADVSEGLDLIAAWELDRKCIEDTLKSLSDSVSIILPRIATILQAEWAKERLHNDFAMLRDLVDRLHFLNPTDRWVVYRRGFHPVSRATRSFDEVYRAMLKSPPQSDLWMVFTLRTLLLSLIPFEILSPLTINPYKTKYRFIEVFNTINELLTAVVSADRSADPTVELQGQWNSLRNLLLFLSSGISPADEIYLKFHNMQQPS